MLYSKDYQIFLNHISKPLIQKIYFDLLGFKYSKHINNKQLKHNNSHYWYSSIISIFENNIILNTYITYTFKNTEMAGALSDTIIKYLISVNHKAINAYKQHYYLTFIGIIEDNLCGFINSDFSPSKSFLSNKDIKRMCNQLISNFKSTNKIILKAPLLERQKYTNKVNNNNAKVKNLIKQISNSTDSNNTKNLLIKANTIICNHVIGKGLCKKIDKIGKK